MKQITHYQIEREIGHGGMSIIYLACDTRNDETVIIKLMRESLREDDDARQRFEQEVHLVQQLTHPNIVPITDSGIADGRFYIVMPYMENGSLRDTLDENSFTLDETLRLLTPVASALDAAHKAGIIHRDIKPHNILCDKHGNAYLSDFSVARLMPEDAEQTTTVIGTPEYIAPEQASGKSLTPQTDIYQLGITIFHMLTGERPFNGNAYQIVAQQLHNELPSVEALNPALPQGCDRVLRRATAKTATNRHESASALIRDLRRLTVELTVTNLLMPDFAEENVEAIMPPQPMHAAVQQARQWHRPALAALILCLLFGTAFISQGATPDISSLSTISFVEDLGTLNASEIVDEIDIPFFNDDESEDEIVVESANESAESTTASTESANALVSASNDDAPAQTTTQQANIEQNDDEQGNNNRGNNNTRDDNNRRPPPDNDNGQPPRNQPPPRN